MMRAGAGKLGRLRADSAALFVCDVQEKFRPGMPSFDTAVKAIGNSMRGAQALGIPSVITGRGRPRFASKFLPCLFSPPATAAIPVPATSPPLPTPHAHLHHQADSTAGPAEQYPEKLGKTVGELSDLVDSSSRCFAKTRFSMLTPEVEKSLKQMSHVHQIMLCGLETHVCVLQTALDLTEQGYEVHVLVDGVISRRQGDRQVALERMKQMGCWMSTSEMAMFQMIAEKEHPKFRDISGIAKDPREDGPWMSSI